MRVGNAVLWRDWEALSGGFPFWHMPLAEKYARDQMIPAAHQLPCAGRCDPGVMRSTFPMEPDRLDDDGEREAAGVWREVLMRLEALKGHSGQCDSGVAH